MRLNMYVFLGKHVHVSGKTRTCFFRFCFICGLRPLPEWKTFRFAGWKALQMNTEINDSKKIYTLVPFL